MPAADVEFPQSLLCSGFPITLIFYVCCVCSNYFHKSWLFFCYTSCQKLWTERFNVVTYVCCFFSKQSFCENDLKKPNPCRTQFCNYMKLPLLKQHIPKAYSLSPCKPLVCSSFSTSSALVQKIISGVSLYLACVPLYRKTSAIRCYKRQWLMDHWPVLRDISTSRLGHERRNERTFQGC